MTTHNHTLLIDAGNSRIKWALGIATSATTIHTIEAQGVVSQGDWRTLQEQWASLHGVQQVWLCSVASIHCEHGLRKCAQEKFGTAPFTVVQARAQHCGVINQYEPPETLGVDRWMMAIAAHNLYAHDYVLIVAAGTATTIDAIDPRGYFLGGVILPGLQLMQQSLAQSTANLPLIEGLHEQPQIGGFAKNTQDAIAGGCLQAQLGAIERLYRQLQQHGTTQQIDQRGHQKVCAEHVVQVVLTGGAASPLAWQLEYPVHLQKNLVLTGLNLVAQAAS